LHDLQNKDNYLRMTAAEDLGKLKISDDKIVSALKVVASSDDNEFVRRAAATALDKLGVGEIRQINRSPIYQTDPVIHKIESNPNTNNPYVQPTELDLLQKLVHLQEKQNSSISEIQKHTGCMYYYLIGSIVVGIIGTIIYILALVPR
jgi:hypothetical protein